MRYFQNRQTAGQMLAQKMDRFQNQNCAVIAVNEGGVEVGSEISKHLQAPLLLLGIQSITVPHELEHITNVASAGTFANNDMIPAGEFEDMNPEFSSYAEQERIKAFQKLNRIVSHDGVVDRDLLQQKTVILVSDGFSNGLSVDVANDFLKPVAIGKFVAVSAIISAAAMERIHTVVDDIVCLNTIDYPLPASHYFQDNTQPDHDVMIDIMKNTILS